MIYGDNFNICHMPKTGGTWLRRVCEKLPKGFIEDIYPHHKGCSDLTEEQAAKPTFIFVRNPWDWYVSLYGHKNGNIRKKRHEFRLPYAQLDEFHKHAYDRFSLPFIDSMNHLRDQATALPTHAIRPANSWMSETFEHFRKPRPGAPAPTVLRYEDGVRESLLRILAEAHPGCVTAHLRRDVMTFPTQNVSERKNYKTYYDPATRALVARHDAHVIRTYGYTY